ncbi:hypothetical protein ACFXKX_31715 [Streptomyces scopuliridis]|uniref:hypothetical protein n=1 Tax=Streptomyces scopuliridis TaxID=452529 RepID=UPI0036B13587
MTRAQLGGLVDGRTASWVRAVEEGRLQTPKLVTILRLAEVLRVRDLSVLTGDQAVRMPRALVHAATGSTVPDVVAGVLDEVLDGPVICHPGAWYYALVPPGTCENWRCPVAVARGRGGRLGIPRPDRTEPAPVTPYWAVPVEPAGKPCAPDAAAELLRVGRARLDGAVRYHDSVRDAHCREHGVTLLWHGEPLTDDGLPHRCWCGCQDEDDTPPQEPAPVGRA